MKTINSWTLVTSEGEKPLVVIKDAYVSGLFKTRKIARTTMRALNDVYGTKLYRVGKVKIEIS